MADDKARKHALIIVNRYMKHKPNAPGKILHNMDDAKPCFEYFLTAMGFEYKIVIDGTAEKIAEALADKWLHVERVIICYSASKNIKQMKQF